MKDTLEGIIALLIIILIVAALIGGIVGLDYLWNRNVSCPNFGTSVQLETKYNFWGGGCFVKATNGQWVKTENYYNAIPITK